MISKTGFFDRSYPAKAWVYFLLFTGANAVLSWAPMGLALRLWVFLMGVLLPLVLAALSMEEAGKKEVPLPRAEFLKAPSRLWWILVLGVAVRLGLAFLPGNWPTWDDGRFAYYSVELLNRWRWVFLFSPTQHPPLFNWVMPFFYKLVPPSLTALRLYPALYSIGALLLVGAAARRLFSRSFAFLLVFLMAFNFWPLYAGRFCMYMTSLVFWECLTLAALAFWASSSPSRRLWVVPLALGLFVAGGFWVSISWPVAALALSATVALLLRQRKKAVWESLVVYLVPVLVSALLFGWLSLRFRNGVHIGQLWAFRRPMDVPRQLMDSASNLTVLFWGCDLQNAYGPVAGGVLNPLEGACFFLGALECWRFRRKPWAVLLASAFLLLLTPGLATKNFDLFRNTQVLPLLLLVTALGAGRALLSISPRSRVWALGLALPCVFFLDLGQTLLTYQPKAPGANRPSSSASARAFPLLREEAGREGPGALLFELRPHESDLTLAMATYTFNATVNPQIPGEKVKWLAVIVDADFQPYLERRFTGGKWFDLFDRATPDLQNANLALGVIPVGAENQAALENWRRADGALRNITWAAANLPEDGDRKGVFKELSRVYPLFKGDPLLESLYWEWVFNFQGWELSYGDRDTAVHFPAALQAVRNELRLGYPAAIFYNELGNFLILERDYPGAREAFEKAFRCPLNLTPAAYNLKALEAMEKNFPSRNVPEN